MLGSIVSIKLKQQITLLVAVHIEQRKPTWVNRVQ